MIGHLFTVLIAQPIFNLLVFIYAILPGHNFGLAIILFTILVRLLLWPLVKKQLHQTKMMRKLQPELKRIKKEAKGDRQKESMMTMELYKERGINPFGSIGVMLVQLPILIALYSGLHKVITNPHDLISFAYPALQNLSWMKELAHNIHLFDASLFGIVDLSRAASGKEGFYFPALILVLGSAIVQFYQTKQLLPNDKDSRSLKTILSEAGSGKSADQSEVNAAVGRSTRYILPVMIFFFTIGLASALSLYWFVGGLVAFIQQSMVLKEDTEEMEAMTDAATKKDVKNIPEAEIVTTTPPKTKKKNAGKKRSSNKKRRK
ncbi:MAG: YidC/Oxa1 family membrane protein insertase [Candidatus Saccharimonadales bacterium]